jgi:serine/threonine protein phosphatase PrpC
VYIITSLFDYDYNEFVNPLEIAALEFSCCTEPGRQRERNEDACAIPSVTANTSGKGTLLVLADGVGGYPGGADASQQAVHVLQALYYAEAGPQHPLDRLRASVESVNVLARLQKRQLGQEDSYLTTLVAAVILEDQIWVANVGDSRAYLVQAASKRRRQLTEDHSGHIRLVKAGLVSDSDSARTSSTITRAIGLEEDCQVDTYHYTWHPGDCLILCSDGLAPLPEEEMVRIALGTATANASKQLVARAIELDGSDNCTVVISKRLLNHESSDKKSTVRLGGKSSTIPAMMTPSVKPKRHRNWRRPVLWVILGVLIGWASAAIVITFWLNASGLINLF